jgi:hypothetical protein
MFAYIPTLRMPHLCVVLESRSLLGGGTESSASQRLQYHHPASAMNSTQNMLLYSQTNDGTTCVYYPNGELAILIVNVFGLYVESSVLSGVNAPSAAAIAAATTAAQNAASSSLVNGFLDSSLLSSNTANNSLGSHLGSILSGANLKNSYTTIVFDRACNNTTPMPPSTAMSTHTAHHANTGAASNTTTYNATAAASNIDKSPQRFPNRSAFFFPLLFLYGILNSGSSDLKPYSLKCSKWGCP